MKLSQAIFTSAMKRRTAIRTMKCLSLWEPWATAIAYDLKRIETRSWSTPYRGPVAIHAAKTTLHAEFIHDERVRSDFEAVGIREVSQLAFGHIVAVARIRHVYRTEELANISEQERAFGNYDAGRALAGIWPIFAG